ncbi:AAA family ATPase [Shinella sp. AETb1-6]|uniref:AAA family ATPase n=1 Tax=Shinella sp. AETb1-6 TaxID=2692210 RepID=UPI00136DAECE|nr:AAA family ATPase [Shinella sp. AETb1-6]MXN53142.1 AAA family ATPase [Shinella sp. AETb1-6]
MIKSISIEGFKRFTSERLEFRNLTILAGRNGSGKTSTIHALLLAVAASQRGDGIAELNGPFGLELGWFESLLNGNTKENSFSVTIEGTEGDAACWSFEEGNTELHASVTLPFVGGEAFSHGPALGFQYLGAERLGPRIVQHSAALPREKLQVGWAGQFTAQVIEKLGSSRIDEGRLFPSSDENPPLLKAQTEQWLSSIVRPVQIDTSTFAGTGITSIAFRVPGGEFVRPTNMGFGVTYALPIVVAALSATTGGILIVENPEAHLHPAGQSDIGIFLARMARAGVQVILETHSDHVLNGIRRAIAELKILSPDAGIIQFFDDADRPPEALEFTESGSFSHWPSGFFDQYQLDIARLNRVRRPR